MIPLLQFFTCIPLNIDPCCASHDCTYGSTDIAACFPMLMFHVSYMYFLLLRMLTVAQLVTDLGTAEEV